MRYIACSVYYIVIKIVFVRSKHILPKEILENSDFADLNSAIATNKEEKVYVIILYLYKSNIQICQEKELNPYHKVHFTMFWFINIIDCQ